MTVAGLHHVQMAMLEGEEAQPVAFYEGGVGRTPVNLTLDNTGSVLAAIQELGFRIVAGGGETVTGGLVPEAPGTYAFECSILGHAGPP